MEFDFNRLKGRMREKGFSQKNLAKSIGIAESTLNQKLNNKLDFGLNEAFMICGILDIQDPTDYFFNQKLSNSKE